MLRFATGSSCDWKTAAAMRRTSKSFNSAVLRYFNWYGYAEGRKGLEFQFDIHAETTETETIVNGNGKKLKLKFNPQFKETVDFIFQHNVHLTRLEAMQNSARAKYMIHQHMFRCGVFHRVITKKESLYSYMKPETETKFYFFTATDSTFRSLLTAAVHYHGVECVILLVSQFTLDFKPKHNNGFGYGSYNKTNTYYTDLKELNLKGFLHTMSSRDEVIEYFKGFPTMTSFTPFWNKRHFMEVINHPLGAR